LSWGTGSCLLLFAFDDYLGIVFAPKNPIGDEGASDRFMFSVGSP
jgi:hypothetical protein